MSNSEAGAGGGTGRDAGSVFGRPTRPLLLVVSAPSGAGKTTLCRMLRESDDTVVYSISCTTRAPREGERDGEDYHFLTGAEFERRVEGGEFLEHAEVHGHRYGTLKESVVSGLRDGHDVLMDIDVQGAAQIRTRAGSAEIDPLIRRGFVDVFIVPPSREALRERLRGRGQDAEETIARRLRNAEGELARWAEYRYVVVNDRLEEAFRALCAIRSAERCRVVG